MITIEREKLKQVLEALDTKYILGCGEWRGQQNKAIITIKEALAQPAQEPMVAGVAHIDDLDIWHFYPMQETVNFPAGTKFYTTPPQQEPRNFCPRCGKRTADLTVIHTCTPPRGLEMT